MLCEVVSGASGALWLLYRAIAVGPATGLAAPPQAAQHLVSPLGWHGLQAGRAAWLAVYREGLAQTRTYLQGAGRHFLGYYQKVQIRFGKHGQESVSPAGLA
jgi:hypothetical protein